MTKLKDRSNAPAPTAASAGADREERNQIILEERRRFSVELHDVVASGLHAALLHLYEARTTLPETELEVRRHIATAEEQILTCWADARRSAAGLRPLTLDQKGLLRTLEDFSRRMENAFGVGVRFNTCGTPRPLSTATELGILRVAQEAVVNALRHSGAQAISLEVSFDADAVRLEVTDNGQGFDANAPADGSGVSGMRDRAWRLGAELAVCSEAGCGTRVSLTLPMDSESDGLQRFSAASTVDVETTLTTHASDVANHSLHAPLPEEFLG
jgi:signal transduction histidine kinase